MSMYQPRIALIMGLSCLLVSCASPPKIVPPVSGPFQRADVNQDTFIDYAEFKNYLAYKAEPYPEETAQLKREEMNGFLAHQKRFLMLDQNNDGKLSYLELGGG